jgi:1-deoxy-D-xylulose-5-phosphate reductoisomerase
MISQGITVLGSTGSIGESTLKVLSRHPQRYHVVALSAHKNISRLAQQCRQHNAKYAVISDVEKVADLQSELDQSGSPAKIIAGPDALCTAAGLDETDTVMAAIVGAAGLESTLHSVQQGKRLLLANKESMVIAGELFRKAATEHSATIIPVDSEHNALFQVLPENFDAGLENVGVERLILTASGGPFLHQDRNSLLNIKSLRPVGCSMPARTRLKSSSIRRVSCIQWWPIGMDPCLRNWGCRICAHPLLTHWRGRNALKRG